ncbi:MAG: EpsD family peptidyl-prolyl cis-trans isomerase [Gallionellaceae bacterium]|nr:EpsD family peptidyl-prolyl cis-trans isomerase [Gallionellaceae bacterium]MDD5366205.1 EpsD family peptidyl-prolyl cis-trans isomerase [Gallionellaceae bacterium]
MPVNKSAMPVSLGIVSLLLIFGCGKIEGNDQQKPAAVVNGKVVAAEQIEAEMAKLGQIPVDQAQSVANRVLRNVVDQELLAQQAAQAKLDSQAEVRMKIDAARRQILAEAQIAVLTKEAVSPAEAEVKAYFDGHPELFSQRRIYKLQELIAGTTPENIAEARELASQAKGPREFATALQAKGIPVGVREVAKAAEDLPDELLVKLNQMKPGEMITTAPGGKLTLVVLADMEQRPVSYEQASPMIERYLANMKKRNQIEVELKKIRTQAKIEYTAPYADISDIAPDQAKP